MTLTEIFQQARTLTVHERKELVKLLVDTLDALQPMQSDSPSEADTGLKTGAEIVALLEHMPPVDLVDPDITDPVAWVQAQRHKETDRLQPYWEG